MYCKVSGKYLKQPFRLLINIIAKKKIIEYISIIKFRRWMCEIVNRLLKSCILHEYVLNIFQKYRLN